MKTDRLLKYLVAGVAVLIVGGLGGILATSTSTPPKAKVAIVSRSADKTPTTVAPVATTTVPAPVTTTTVAPAPVASAPTPAPVVQSQAPVAQAQAPASTTPTTVPAVPVVAPYPTCTAQQNQWLQQNYSSEFPGFSGPPKMPQDGSEYNTPWNGCIYSG